MFFSLYVILKLTKLVFYNISKFYCLSTYYVHFTIRPMMRSTDKANNETGEANVKKKLLFKLNKVLKKVS